jgi:lipopolysaccharide transport system permease protein
MLLENVEQPQGKGVSTNQEAVPAFEPVEPGYWDMEITPGRSLFLLNMREVWAYRDLLRLFVRRDFVAQYKQTILGPTWYFIQPVFTTVIFTFVFGKMAGIPTDGIPPLLFYLAGITNWNYFADCLNKTSSTFRDNQGIFGKVYFPRLVVPLSIVASNLVKYAIQLLLLLGFFAYYILAGADVKPNVALLLFPVLLLMLSGLGLGFGLLITSMTTKYRDLVYLLQFGVQLLMYATPVIYPLSQIPKHYQWIIVLNPMTSIIETFKYGLLGHGTFEWGYLGYSAVFTIVLVLLGSVVFNWTEKNFMDTV